MVRPCGNGVQRSPRAHFVNHWSNDPWKDLEGNSGCGGRRQNCEHRAVVLAPDVPGGRVPRCGRRHRRGQHACPSTAAGGWRRGCCRTRWDSCGNGASPSRPWPAIRGIYGAEGWERIPLYYALDPDGGGGGQVPSDIRPADLGVVAELETLAAPLRCLCPPLQRDLGARPPWLLEGLVPHRVPRVWVAEAQGAIRAYLSLSANGKKEGLEVKESSPAMRSSRTTAANGHSRR